MELTKGSPVHVEIEDGDCHAAIVLKVTNQFPYTSPEYRVEIRDMETDQAGIVGAGNLHEAGTCPTKSARVELPPVGTPSQMVSGTVDLPALQAEVNILVGRVDSWSNSLSSVSALAGDVSLLKSTVTAIQTQLADLTAKITPLIELGQKA